MSYIQSTQRDLLDIIKYPILTEKTIRLIEQNQYSFAVDSKADKLAVKSAVKSAVEQLFDVKVISVNTSLLPLKKRRVGKFIGKKARYKRAIVKLASEDSISLFDEE
jgi:large subunit ribosomal protein L23